MAKSYERADDELVDRAQALIDKYYPAFNKIELKIDFVYAMNEDGKPAITKGGVQCLGLCRIVNLKDRAMDRGDVEILIDMAHYKAMQVKQRDGLLHHELNHIILVPDPDDDTKVATDDLNRPKIKMRKHDWDIGWFTDIARVHGNNSPEVYQAKILWAKDGQSFFPMLTEK